MFLHLSVILSTGECLPQCMLGYHNPPSRHPPGPGPPGTRHPPNLYPPGAEMATTADSTHHTGMHYCYRPQTKFAKVMFLQVSVCPHGGCAWFYLGGHAWFYLGACMVLFGGGVHGFIQRDVCGFIRGCVWFYLLGCAWFYSGVCVWFYLGGHAWFYLGGACVVLFGGGMCGFFSFFGYNEIRSMSGRYSSYWNAFLFQYNFVYSCLLIRNFRYGYSIPLTVVFCRNVFLIMFYHIILRKNRKNEKKNLDINFFLLE